MFERYTERARRVIFFARYEASQYGSRTIETEHMLLGLLREDRPTLDILLGSAEATRELSRDLSQQCIPKEKISPTMDLPLTDECKRTLAFAAEEAERLNHRHVGTEHLLLGLLRLEESVAAKTLGRHGLTLAGARETLSTSLSAIKAEQGRHTSLISSAAVFQVKDVAQSVEWYRKMLGFDADSFGNPSDPPFATLRREGVGILLQKADPAAETAPAARVSGVFDVYIHVRDIRSFRSAIQAKFDREIPIRDTIYGCSEFSLTDPDGHVLVFAECRSNPRGVLTSRTDA